MNDRRAYREAQERVNWLMDACLIAFLLIVTSGLFVGAWRAFARWVM